MINKGDGAKHDALRKYKTNMFYCGGYTSHKISHLIAGVRDKTVTPGSEDNW